MFKQFSRQRVAGVVMQYHGEVCNGGHFQYFVNKEAWDHNEVLAALSAVGAVKAAEISPSTGVTVTALKGNSSETEQAIGWWEVTLDIAKDAAPGDRSLVLVMMKTGRTAPTTFSISTHVPTISDLRVVPPQSNQAPIELILAASDPAGDLGDSPYVWFSADCGGEPIVGAVRGTVSAGVVRALIPNLHKAAAGGTATPIKCDFQVRVTDSTGIESNTLKTTVEFRN